MSVYCKDCLFMRKEYYPNRYPHYCIAEQVVKDTPIKKIVVYPRCVNKNLLNDCKDYRKAPWWKKFIR